MHTEEAEAWLVLNASGLAPALQRGLVESLGSAPAVLAASAERLREVPGVTSRHLQALAECRQSLDLARQRELCLRTGVHLVSYRDEEYPVLLAQIYDPPPLLFVQGELTRDDDLAVALVGTRKASPYGLKTARRLARDLAQRGFTIVSGLALGVDGEAHEGALEAGGRSVGVMATGADITYPSEHSSLRERLAPSGAVLTELAFGSRPTRYAFPARNRLVSGLCLGTIVVEAPLKSGALLTAHHALDQGREVFAVPGNVEDPLARGCHQLLKEGAHLVENAEDVVEGLGLMLTAVPSRPQRPQAELSQEEQQVYDTLGAQPRRVDQMVEATGLGAAQVGATLMLLEVKGLARRFAGGAYLRVQ